ncbi:hypothetical protein ANCCEY_01456 [Ancylostoma ceylanicum]|uniref:Uncharacterized protein n=1 Tax=Ancylostoma ceylanicum TaxID=53326 RepID=A0A0D6MA56_9BILA|nr:hypothetical protein ANCCEY_01456 [Ancylostoma ceylanicum]
MLDPFTLACILAVVAAVIAIVFYLFSGSDDERDFEKAFGENARKLLSQDREKHKSKVKVTKKKDLKEKRAETKLDGDLDSEAATAIEPTPELKTEPAEPAALSTSTTSVKTASPPEPKVKKHSKKEKSIAGNASASEPEESKPEAAPVSNEETAAVSEHFLDENKENRGDQASTSEGKKKRKSKIKKEEDVIVAKTVAPEADQNCIVKEAQANVAVETVTTTSTKEKEKKPKKKITVVNINDLDSNKVLTRIASLEEIEPEYISYLATYFHDTNAKVNSLEHTINELERKEADHKKKIEQHQQSRAIADRQIADHVRVISELTSKLQTLTVSEASAKQQIIQLNNVRLENDTLKSALSKSAADAAAAAKAIANLKTVEANHAEVNERLAKMTKSLNETVEENASLKRQIAGFSEQITALEHLKKEFAALDTAAHQLKAELEEKTRVIEETNRMASAVDSGKRAECERDEIAHQFAQARSEWEKKEAALMNEYTSLKNLVDELNKEVAKFEQFKKEQDELEQKLLAKEAELAEKSARLAAAENEKQVLVGKGNDRSAELESENAALRKKVADLEKKLSDVEKSHAKALSEASAAHAAAGDEVMVLKRTQTVEACRPSASANDAEIISLRSENHRLQHKNEELRKRNFKILDDVAYLEKELAARISSSSPDSRKSKKGDNDSNNKQLLEERKLVASAIGSLVHSPLNDSSYDDYVHQLAKSLKSALHESGKKEKKDRSKDHSKDHSKAQAKMQAEIDNYRNAFSSLSALLTQIEMGVEERESFYKEKVAALESALEKANAVASSADRLKKELRECELLKKQIEALRTCLGQNANDDKTPTSAKPCTVKSDESDWEVVL